jgi:NAD(P)-dependent dehydrogenase (short-subunit alcohol dehydrogenase family)
MAISTDATSPQQIKAMFDRTLQEFGRVDVLINNAGIVRGQQRKALWDITDDEWRVGIDVNLSSAFYTTRAIIKYMVDRGSGRIVNVSSGFGLRGGRDNYMYACGKGGIIQLTRVLAVTYGSMGVTSTCIVPGFIPTESSTTSGFSSRNDFIPLGRSGYPQEIGPLAVFLASDASEYMNGEMFYCDGGALAAGASPTGYAPVIPLEN